MANFERRRIGRTSLEVTVLGLGTAKCVARGVSIVVGGPYNSGILVGRDREIAALGRADPALIIPLMFLYQPN